MKLPQHSLLLRSPVLIRVLFDKILDERLQYRIVSCPADLGAAYGTGVFCGVKVAERGEPGLGAGTAVCVKTVEKRHGVVEQVGADLLEM